MIPYFLVLKKKRYTVDLTNNGPNLIQNLFCISADGLPMNGNKMVFICLSIRLLYLFVVFFKTFLKDITPFCGATDTPVLDFCFDILG